MSEIPNKSRLTEYPIKVLEAYDAIEQLLVGKRIGKENMFKAKALLHILSELHQPTNVTVNIHSLIGSMKVKSLDELEDEVFKNLKNALKNLENGKNRKT